jgi:hypothetical protein
VNLLELLFVSFIGWIGWRTIRRIQQSTSTQERALNVRAMIALWILAAVFVAALIAIPGRARIFLMIPLVLVMGSAMKAYRNSRRDLRESADLTERLKRMKRVH